MTKFKIIRKYSKRRRKFEATAENHLFVGEKYIKPIGSPAKDPTESTDSEKSKCCINHYTATNRFERRVADRKCPCRGLCGCRNKVKHNG